MIVLSNDYMDRQKARAVPGSQFVKGVGWFIENPTARAAAVALKLFPELITTHPELLALRESLAQDVRPIDCATPYGHTIHASRVEFQLEQRGLDFYEFQAIDLGYLAAVLRAHGSAYLGWDRGMGKTLGACALIDNLDCQRTLIVCPNTAKQAVWADELRRWCPWLYVHVLPNEKRRRELMMNAIRDDKGPMVLVAHYEALAIIGKTRQAWDKFGEWDMVVCDEGRRLSNPKAQMVRAAKKIPARRKLLMDGSVIQNHAEELFSQLQWLFPDRYRSKYRDWNDRYLDFVDSGFAKVCVGVRVERIAEIRDELGRFMVYRRKQDELDLPKRTDETRLVDLTGAQRRVYDELAESYIADLGEAERPITATDGLVLLTRLRQVATGLDLVSGELADSSKQDLAVDIIRDTSDEAFVVFSWYKAAATSLAERLRSLGIESFVVTGDTKPSDRAESIAAFQSGERRVFIGTISTLGESVTLHRANNAIFLDRSWNPAQNEQAEDRIYRIGQENAVTVTHIVARDTVDEQRVLPVLTDKSAIRRMILGESPRAPFTQRRPELTPTVELAA